ncbi:MAG: hypothetical protein QM737_09910 [Ferruginibacter sp.]
MNLQNTPSENAFIAHLKSNTEKAVKFANEIDKEFEGTKSKAGDLIESAFFKGSFNASIASINFSRTLNNLQSPQESEFSDSDQQNILDEIQAKETFQDKENYFYDLLDQAGFVAPSKIAKK